jgi:hypothetical protein
MPEDLSDEEAVEQFEYIASRNPAYREVKSNHRTEIIEDTSEADDIRTRLDEGIRNQRKHDTLLESTISVFLPTGPVASQTDWRFLGAEPLSELNVPNADAIFGNPSRNVGVIVECKSGMSRPGQALDQLYDAADAVWEYHDHLAENIGMEISELECVICIPSTDDNRITREIEEQERNGNDRERVFVWRLHYLQDGEQLDLFTRIDSRDSGEATHDNQLASLLRPGVDVGGESQITPSFFPSSHLFKIMESAVATLLEKRKKDDGPIRHFSGEELLGILTDQRHLPHYNAEDIGARIYTSLIDRLLQFDLVTEVDDTDTDLEGTGDFYRYRVTGRSISTIISNMKEKYREQYVDWRIDLQAIRRTIDEYDEEQSTLGDY